MGYPADLTEIAGRELSPWLNSPIVVAFSGGVDSTVLLHLLVELKKCQKIKSLRAVHVNHGLSPNARYWVEHCQKICCEWGVPFHVEEVKVKNNGGQGLEQAARAARYEIFERLLSSGDCLVQGHHQNDQAETLLFRLFRGTGIDGMTGIPRSRPLGRSVLVRPLLSVSRDQIECYASKHNLPHIEDESNHDQHFSRNYLRHSLLPAVEKRWPGASVRLSALADEMVSMNEQLADYIAELTRSVLQTRPEWLLGNQPLVDCVKLQGFKPATQKQIIRFWLKSQELPVPGRELLDNLFTQAVNARVDATPLFCWPGCQLRRYQGLLVAARPSPESKPVGNVYWDWSAQPDFFHETLGILRVRARQIDDLGVQGVNLPVRILEIRTREKIDPSMKISVAGRAGRKTLKRWLQAFNIPPWLRNRIPFLFFKDEMVAAPGLWVCDNYRAQGEEGYQIIWSAPAID
ncbi:tRNA lysidine(34) synthetase TilS [Endozoicomonas sp. Mp262]|uniref:tRNA lysidine(34) synthetase TilS n=1 Tax=Endozoicomonas sp. Mp262 TaxID=2919499 RepID=UPI0021DB087E